MTRSTSSPPPLAGPIHHLIVVVAVTVTPGTAVVDVDPETSTWTIHLLRADRIDEVRDHIDELVALVNEAIVLPGPAGDGDPGDGTGRPERPEVTA